MGGGTCSFRPANYRFPTRPQRGMGRQVSIMQIDAEQGIFGDPQACRHIRPATQRTRQVLCQRRRMDMASTVRPTV